MVHWNVLAPGAPSSLRVVAPNALAALSAVATDIAKPGVWSFERAEADTWLVRDVERGRLYVVQRAR